jgi:transposase
MTGNLSERGTMRTNKTILTDDIVAHLRKRVLAGTAESYSTYAKRYGTTKGAILNAVRGRSFKHVTTPIPPSRARASILGRKDEVQKLYKSGASVLKIAAALNMSTTSVKTLCQDVVKTNELELIAKKEKARELYLSGEYSNLRIAKLVGVHRHTVRKWCSDFAGKRCKIPNYNKNRITKSPMALSPFEGHRLYVCTVSGVKRAKLVHVETKHVLTMTLARYTMSVHLNRTLERNESVVTRDGGDPSNLSDLTFMVKTDPTCLTCSAPFKRNGKDHKYCSRTCRPRPTTRRNKEYTHNCAICEEPFTSRKKEADFCGSKECKAIIQEYKY